MERMPDDRSLVRRVNCDLGFFDEEVGRVTGGEPRIGAYALFECPEASVTDLPEQILLPLLADPAPTMVW
jgi:hypothetical protein